MCQFPIEMCVEIKTHTTKTESFYFSQLCKLSLCIFSYQFSVVTSNSENVFRVYKIEFPISIGRYTDSVAILINRNVIVFILENISGFVGLFHCNWRHNQYSSRRNAYRIQFTNCRTYIQQHQHTHTHTR